ncbi:hypothetical protein S7335_2181 [Synechococcus sp. PCC 7335]|nr:hypothetical protein S7335_2181 [Synechococcus sp. PCC 7335]
MSALLKQPFFSSMALEALSLAYCLLVLSVFWFSRSTFLYI